MTCTSTRLLIATGTLSTLLAVSTACTSDKGPDYQYNNPPRSDAGSDVSQPADQRVSLDGQGSYDPDGDVITYHWSFDHLPADSALDEREAPFSANRSAAASTTTFYPDVVGTYVITLMVHDGTDWSEADYVVVEASEPDQLPVADAGDDDEIDLGDTVTLDGSGSYDPLGGSLTYAWTLVNVPYASSLTATDLADSETITPSFKPDALGDYTITLTVSNGMASSGADSVTITAGGDNEAPTADAGSDVSDFDCTAITLDCTASTDPEGAVLSYFWEVQSRPSSSAVDESSFGSRTDGETTFFADVAGAYEISCSVYDGTNWSLPDTLSLTLAERSSNTAPTVNAGADFTEDAGEAYCEPDGYVYDCDECSSTSGTLGADASITDADGDPYIVEWVLDEDASDSDGASISSEESVSSTVIFAETTPEEPAACTQTAFTFHLSATDCPGATGTDSVIATVQCCGTDQADTDGS